jgi:hypothetical protein
MVYQGLDLIVDDHVVFPLPFLTTYYPINGLIDKLILERAQVNINDR